MMGRMMAPPPPNELLPALPAGLICPDCGYDVRGLTSDRCPECGSHLAILRDAESHIPWVHRRERGRLRAYCQTVWLVVRRPRHLAAEHARPVSYADAQRFRWMTILLVFGSFVVTHGVGVAVGAPTDEVYEEGGWLLALAGAVGLLWLAAITGIPSYFFHRRYLSIAQQNRAIALSYYACAALALMPAFLFLWGPCAILVGLLGGDEDDAGRIGYVLFNAVFPVVLAFYLALLVQLARRLLRRRGAATWLAVLVPVLWLVSGVLLLTLALVVGYVIVMVHAAQRGA